MCQNRRDDAAGVQHSVVSAMIVQRVAAPALQNGVLSEHEAMKTPL